MKVLFNEPMAGKDIVYNTEDVYELPTAQAKRFIDAGICTEKIEAPKPKKANIKTKKKK